MGPNSKANSQASKIGVAVAVPAAVLMVPLVVIALSYWKVVKNAKLQRRKEEKKAIEEKEREPGIKVVDDVQSYFQRKGELGTEEQAKYEMQAEQQQQQCELQACRARYELEGDDHLQELSATKDQRRVSVLRGHKLDARDQQSLDSSLRTMLHKEF